MEKRRHTKATRTIIDGEAFVHNALTVRQKSNDCVLRGYGVGPQERTWLEGISGLDIRGFTFDLPGSLNVPRNSRGRYCGFLRPERRNNDCERRQAEKSLDRGGSHEGEQPDRELGYFCTCGDDVPSIDPEKCANLRHASTIL